jgi:hypothetical protein
LLIFHSTRLIRDVTVSKEPFRLERLFTVMNVYKM